ncbi:MAG: DUF11 domain-containing protein [Deltaproteobacteria bacterium]|nr:DUF11 domain-containing protein [Deltaproteobacteria bacterium]
MSEKKKSHRKKNSSIFSGKRLIRKTVLIILILLLTAVDGMADGGVDPNILAVPAALDFGLVPRGATTAPQTVTITNAGAADLAISVVLLGGGHAPDYSILSDTCSGAVLSPAADCGINVDFSPAVAGSLGASLDIVSDGPGTPTLSLPLTGQGQAIADLGVTLNVDQPVPEAGDTIVFMVTAANGGPDDATGAALDFILPDGLTYQSDDAGGTYDESSGRWTAGLLTNGASTSLRVTARVDSGSGGAIIEPAVNGLISDQYDPDSGNNASAQTVNVRKHLYVNVGNSIGPLWDGTMEAPYRTIQAAVDMASYATAIHVARGVYMENVTVSTEVPIPPYELRIEGGWDAAFTGRSTDGSLTAINGKGTGACLDVVNTLTLGLELTVDTLTFTGGTDGMRVFANNQTHVFSHNNRYTGNNSTWNNVGLSLSGGVMTESVDDIFTYNINGIKAESQLVMQHGKVTNNQDTGVWIENAPFTAIDSRIASNRSGLSYTSNDGAYPFLLERSIVEENDNHGVRIYFYDNNADGDSFSPSALIINSKICRNHGDGVTVTGGSFNGYIDSAAVNISSSTISGNHKNGIIAYDYNNQIGLTVNLDGVIIWNSGVDDVHAESGTVSVAASDIGALSITGSGNYIDRGNNLAVDPLLVPDGHLQSASPCRDTGDALTAPADDFEGEARPADAGPDMGADEFLDSDSDGLPDGWEMQYAGDPREMTPSGDEDADGHDNLDEYINGWNPSRSGLPTLTDVNYTLASESFAWDGVDMAEMSGSGDEASFSYTLPWPVYFYGVSYEQVTVDSNGNTWFAHDGSEHDIDLPDEGYGPVISAWNTDLSSDFEDEFRIQHKNNPERVVIEWDTETYDEEDSGNLNNFEVVIFRDGTLRIDYRLFECEGCDDSGSGISSDDDENYLDISFNYGPVYDLHRRSFLFSLPDTDNDGMADGWESVNGLVVGEDDSLLDPDEDGLNNLDEYLNHALPGNADTDGDGLGDGEEVHTLSTLAYDPDTDDDGLSDGADVTLGTDPNRTDTDGDGVIDSAESVFNSDPVIPGSGMAVLAMLGQTDNQGVDIANGQYTSGGSNDVGPTGLENPEGIAADPVNHRLFVADTGNNRILVFDLDSANNIADHRAAHVLGQPDFDHEDGDRNHDPGPETLDAPEGVAFYDEGPRLWLFVADTGNHRVLIYDITTGIVDGMAADIVLGQADFTGDQANRSGIDYGCSPAEVDATTLNMPVNVIMADIGTTPLLLVADTDNNRVLGWNVGNGIAGLSSGQAADYVIGQPDFKTRSSNSCGSASAATLDDPYGLAVSNTLLFVGDRYNDRIMGFDLGEEASGLAATTAGLEAVLVIGQAAFNGKSGNQGGSADANTLSDTRYLAVSGDYLFAVDENNDRTLVYDLTGLSQFNTTAVFVFGKPDFTSTGNTLTASGAADPWGIAVAGSKLMISDNQYNRVAFYDIADLTSAIGNSDFGPPAFDLAGQTDWYSGSAAAIHPVFDAAGNDDVNSVGLEEPRDAVVGIAAGAPFLFVAGAANNRVLAYESDVNGVPLDLKADFVLGQADFEHEQEDTTVTGMHQPIGVAFDDETEYLFVADSGNNRILVFDLSSGIASGMAASFVLGQPDFTSDTSGISQRTVFLPRRMDTGTIQSGPDAGKRYLFVADKGHTRVMLFNIGDGVTTYEPADHVLGSSSFTSWDMTPDQETLSQPFGLDFDDASGILYVVDSGSSSNYVANRVMVFDLSDGIVDGEAAVHVLGQADFDTTLPRTTRDGLSYPQDVSYDAMRGLLWVVDSRNNRVVAYNTADGITDGEGAVTVLGQTSFITGEDHGDGQRNAYTMDWPSGIYINAAGDLFIAQEDDDRLVIYADPVAGVGISSVDDADPVLVGESFTYTLTVTNQGDPATRVKVTDTLPAGAGFDSVDASRGTCVESDRVVVCDLGVLERGASVTINIGVTAQAVELGRNEARVETYITDSSDDDDLAVEETRFAIADVLVHTDEWTTALALDGVDDGVIVGDSAALDISSALTLTAWFRYDGRTGENGAIVQKDGPGTWGRYGLWLENGNLEFCVFIDGDRQYCLSSESTIPSDQWQHAAGVFDGNTMFLYLNGALAARRAVSGSISVSSQSLYIGADSGDNMYLHGLIDEVSLWNTALDQAAISGWMHRAIDPAHPFYENLVGYWDFNEGEGITAHDVSGNGNNGALTGTDNVSAWRPSPVIAVPVREGNRISYEFVLAGQPVAPVTIAIEADQEVAPDKTRLIFTADDWFQPQTLEIEAVVDNISETDSLNIIGLSVQSNDPLYDGIQPEPIFLLILDADLAENLAPEPPALTSPVSGKVLPEGEVTLDAGVFNDPEGDGQQDSRWQVWRQDRPRDIVAENRETKGDLTASIVSGLAPNLAYEWRAGYSDIGSNGISWADPGRFIIGAYDTQTIRVAEGLRLADYRMISFTQWFSDQAADQVFTMPDNLEDFRFGAYNPGTGSYEQYTDGVPLIPGRAYWVLVRQGREISTRGVSVTLNLPVDVRLDYSTESGNGWNMIAPPNKMKYAWAAVEVLHQGVSVGTIESLAADNPKNPWINTSLWRWQRGRYFSDTVTLEDHSGYWVKARSEEVSLRFIPDARLGLLDNPAVTVLAMLHGVEAGVKRWMSPNAAIAGADDTPPLPMSGLDEGPNVGTGGCLINVIRDGSSFSGDFSVQRHFSALPRTPAFRAWLTSGSIVIFFLLIFLVTVFRTRRKNMGA